MSDFAWVTLATNDSYSLGALVLAHALRRVGTRYQLVVMVTPGVTNEMREKLANVFDLVFEINILDSKDEENLKLLQRPELGITFTKLHCWRLTQYKKCVFLDADTLVLQNCDELFDREEFSAAPDVGWPDCFNSGVFVYKPSDETYNSLLAFALERGSFDGGDQGLLNLYFSDWARKDINKHLPFIYNMCSTASYSYLPAFKHFGENVKIVHFIGASKPWLQYFNTERMEVTCVPGFNHLQVVFTHWWNIFCECVHSRLVPTMARNNTTIASSCTSPSDILTYFINESKCEDRLKSEQNFDIHLNNISVYDPWEQCVEKLNDNIIDTSIAPQTNEIVNEFDADLDNVNIINCTENKCISDKFCMNNAHSNELCTSKYEEDYRTSGLYQNSSIPDLSDKHTVINVHISKDNSSIPDTIVFSQDTLNACTTSHKHYQSVNSAVVYDTKPTSAVTTEQPTLTVTHLDSTEAETDQNGGLAGVFAQMTLGQPRSADQGALEEHLRRQGWEVGKIDYLGQDSFDNIWKKICETMAAPVDTEPSKEIQPAETSTSAEKISGTSALESSSPVIAAVSPSNVTESKISATDAVKSLEDANINKQHMDTTSITELHKSSENIKLETSEPKEITKVADTTLSAEPHEITQAAQTTVGETPQSAPLSVLEQQDSIIEPSPAEQAAKAVIGEESETSKTSESVSVAVLEKPDSSSPTDTVSGKSKTEVQQGHFSATEESKPTPPPRKGGKSGGATAKKSSKKK